MREFKIVRLNASGDKLVTEYELFDDFDAADAWAAKRNKIRPGEVLDIEFMDVNEELKYEY